VPAVVFCPSVAPPVADPAAGWRHFQRTFPELAAALPHCKSTATPARAATAATAATAESESGAAVTTHGGLCPTAQEVALCWLPLLLGEHYTPWRAQHGLPPLADALLARCQLLVASQEQPQECSPPTLPSCAPPELLPASISGFSESSNMSSFLARARAWKQNLPTQQSQPSNAYVSSGFGSNVSSGNSGGRGDVNSSSSMSQRPRLGVPPSSVPILNGLDTLLMSSHDVVEDSKCVGEHSSLHPMDLMKEGAVPTTWPSRSMCLGAFHQDDAIIRRDQAIFLAAACDFDCGGSSSGEAVGRCSEYASSKRRRSELDSCVATERLDLEHFIDSASSAKALVVLIDMGSMAALAGDLNDSKDGDGNNSLYGSDSVEARPSVTALVDMVYSEVGAAAFMNDSSRHQQDVASKHPHPLSVRVLFLSHNLTPRLHATINNTVDKINSQSKSDRTAVRLASPIDDAPTALHYTGTVSHAWLFWRLGCSSSSSDGCRNDYAVKNSHSHCTDSSSSNVTGPIGGDSFANSGSIYESVDTSNAAMVANEQSAPRVVWLHHGGAGSTACAARWGVPQIIVPLAMDQGFWAQRVEDLGVGAVVDLALLVDDMYGSVSYKEASSATTTATATARRRVTAFETASAIEKCRASVRVALQQSLSLVCTSKYGAAAKALGTAMERENSAAKYRKITRGESLPRGHVGSSLGAMAAAEAALEAAKYL